jgi:hypothetical protein
MTKENIEMFQIKKTLDGRRPQMEDYLKYQKWNISATIGWFFPKF